MTRKWRRNFQTFLTPYRYSILDWRPGWKIWRWFQRKQRTDIKCWPRLFLPDCTLFYDVVLFWSGPPVLPSSDSRKSLFENYSRSAMLYWFTVQTFYWTSNSLADTGKNQNKNQVSNLISEKARNKETQSLSKTSISLYSDSIELS